MKILWFTEFYPKQDKMIGGVQARCYYVGREISKKNGLKVIEGIPEKYARASFGSFLLRLLLMPAEIYQGLTVEFDLVEASNGVMYFPAWIVGKIKKKPIVFWYPDVFISSWVKNVGPVGILGELIERFILTLDVNHYIAISNVVQEKLIAHGIPPEKISVIYCGVDEQEIAQVIKKNKTRDLIVVSRLIKYKKVDQVISSLNKEQSLAIIGWGPEEANLRNQAGKNVSFLGTITSHKAVLQEIENSRIFCHPSTVEGFGISIIEAMALGVPVLLPDTQIANEITKNGQGSLLFNSENINKLLTDKSLYAKKSKEAIALSKNYSWKNISKETLKLYENLYHH